MESRKEGRKEESALGSRPAMEVFDGVAFVRLRCCARRGKYLAAEKDGRTVCLSGKRGVHNTVWAVQPAEGRDGAPCVLLRGAYGRYLLASYFPLDFGPGADFEVHQEGLYKLPPGYGYQWQAFRRGSSFVLRSASRRYLRAHGKYRRSRKMVTTTEDTGSSMIRWAIESVPVRATPPFILDPTRQLTHSTDRVPTESEVTRSIRYIRGRADGTYDEDKEAWATMQFRSSNLMQLRLTLACRLGKGWGADQTTLCIRGGTLGQLTPLVVDLPIGNDPIDIVIFRIGTQGDNDLQYPDLDARTK
ncbi:hypothetical protein ACP70R_033319 [Stipagrostis hirtigluma subsp. patula]